ncbi:MAG: methyltransferase type 11 [uncultured bacterium]|nr:MAG: methyltransferase type 11 [uncultured bacterium]
MTRHLKLDPTTSILDVCCGVGRHSIPLAKKGCRVQGVDISKKYLKIAKKKAFVNKLPAQFSLGDARLLKFDNQFDIALNLFSSLGYFINASDDHKIIRGIYRALKPDGKLVIEIYNSTRILHMLDFCHKHHWLSTQWSEASNKEFIVLADPQVLKRQKAFMNHFIFLYKNGVRKEMKTFNRIFTLDDLSHLLEANKFKILKVYGGLDGSKYHPLTSENMVLIAGK